MAPWQRNWQDKEKTKTFKCPECRTIYKSQQNSIICPDCSRKLGYKVYCDEA